MKALRRELPSFSYIHTGKEMNRLVILERERESKKERK